MMRRTAIVGILALGLTALTLFAHEPYGVVGTITKWKDPILEVTSKEDGVVPIRLMPVTRILRNGKKIERKDLRVGLDVSVYAIGDSLADLEASRVDVVSGATSNPAK